MQPDTLSVAHLLEAVSNGDRDAVDQLFGVVYGELRAVAHARRREWSGNETLNTTAIVHEAYLKLVRADRVHARDRSHFFALASRAMRQVLVNYARDRKAEKRGGEAPHVALDFDLGLPTSQSSPDDELIALDQALRDLEQIEGRPARVVECRFFGGLSVQEAAEVLGVSEATVKRDWARACTWLRGRLDAPS